MEKIQEIQMKKDQKAAKIAGALFIITMIAGVIDAKIIAPVLNDSLINVYLNQNLVIIAVVHIMVMSLGIVGIAIVLYPVLKMHNEAIALTYISFRIIECVLLVFGALCYFYLIILSQEYITAGNQDVSYFQTSAAIAIKMKYYAYQLAMITLGLGSLFLCYLLFQSKLIPLFLSVWGFIGFPIWIFIKGFNSSVITSSSAKAVSS
jgi:Domain of unknown function (DUF4386)